MQERLMVDGPRGPRIDRYQVREILEAIDALETRYVGPIMSRSEAIRLVHDRENDDGSEPGLDYFEIVDLRSAVHGVEFWIRRVDEPNPRYSGRDPQLTT